MREETEIVFSTISGKEKYDEVCKSFWLIKEIMAPVLQHTVKEYQHLTIPEIIRCINADTISDKMPVDDLPAFIKCSDMELSSPTEKRVFFDVSFTAKNPNLSSKDILVMLHINFEVQNSYRPSNPSYPVTKRAIYYAARALSSQLKIVAEHTDYSTLEKVYSIWVCNEKVSKRLQNTITRYHIVREDIVGSCDENEAYHDLMESIIVRRGTNAPEDTLFEYLQGVFTSNLETINKYVDVKNNDKVKEVVKTMSGLGESLENKGFEKGLAEGLKLSVKTLYDFVPDAKQIHAVVVKNEPYQNVTLEQVEEILAELNSK